MKALCLWCERPFEPRSDGGSPRRFLATIAKAHEAVQNYTEARERAHACYELVQADPDKPQGGPVDFAVAERETWRDTSSHRSEHDEVVGSQ
jgi:hypothetical protein